MKISILQEKKIQNGIVFDIHPHEVMAFITNEQVNLLSEPETAVLQSFPAQSPRHSEYTLGRSAARLAHAYLLDAENMDLAAHASKYSILSNEHGAPVLVKNKNELQGTDFGFSISHGKSGALAMAWHKEKMAGAFGLDLLEGRDRARMEKLSARVLSDFEKEAHLKNPTQDIPRLAWGTREAVAKATQTGMFSFALSHVQINAIYPDEHRILCNLPETDIVYGVLPGELLWVLAFVTDRTIALAQKISLATSAHSE